MKKQCSADDVRTWYSKEVRCWVSKCAHGTLSQHTKQPMAIESAVDACRMVDEYCAANNITRTVEQIYGRDGKPTAEGKEMLARMDAERIERNKDIAGLIDEKGDLTRAGLSRFHELQRTIRDVLVGSHLDNTGAQCRIDLDGHDCCCTCNAAEDMLRATAKYYEGR